MKTKGSYKISDEVLTKAKIMAIKGHSERYIAKNLGISTYEVNKVKKDSDFPRLQADYKKELVKNLLDIAFRCFTAITDEKLKKSGAYQLVTMMAIAIDKTQLLTGDVTERLGFVDEREVNEKLRELETAEKELKEAWFRAERQRKAAESGKQISKDSTNEH